MLKVHIWELKDIRSHTYELNAKMFVFWKNLEMTWQKKNAYKLIGAASNYKTRLLRQLITELYDFYTNWIHSADWANYEDWYGFYKKQISFTDGPLAMKWNTNSKLCNIWQRIILKFQEKVTNFKRKWI